MTAVATKRQPTPREAEVLGHLVAGRTTAEVAVLLGVSPATVHGHLRTARERLACDTRAELLAWAHRHHHELPGG